MISLIYQCVSCTSFMHTRTKLANPLPNAIYGIISPSGVDWIRNPLFCQLFY